jgi:hypothetical protein
LAFPKKLTQLESAWSSAAKFVRASSDTPRVSFPSTNTAISPAVVSMISTYEKAAGIPPLGNFLISSELRIIRWNR